MFFFGAEDNQIYGGTGCGIDIRNNVSCVLINNKIHTHGRKSNVNSASIFLIIGTGALLPHWLIARRLNTLMGMVLTGSGTISKHS